MVGTSKVIIVPGYGLAAARAQHEIASLAALLEEQGPAARRPGTPVSGMPILDVDRAKSVVVIKRSMGHGYAGIDNELYTAPHTGMLFADAKQGVTDLVAALRALVR
jgi:H+-translocating NAD(P) transhydrogenase subunit beta